MSIEVWGRNRVRVATRTGCDQERAGFRDVEAEDVQDAQERSVGTGKAKSARDVTKGTPKRLAAAASVVHRGVVHVERKTGLYTANVRGFHSFRVTWITMALASVVPMKLVRRVTGHKTVDVALEGGTVAMRVRRRSPQLDVSTVPVRWDRLHFSTGNPALTLSGAELVVTVEEALEVGDSFRIVTVVGRTALSGTFANPNDEVAGEFGPDRYIFDILDGTDKGCHAHGRGTRRSPTRQPSRDPDRGCAPGFTSRVERGPRAVMGFMPLIPWPPLYSTAIRG